jgi:hypothetical protein
MRVRIFAGETWSAAIVRGDHEFELLPAIGHKLAFASDGAWDVAVVRDIAHRLVDPDEAPDIAVLMSPPTRGGSVDEALPLALLDARLRPAASVSVPRTAGPWGGGS